MNMPVTIGRYTVLKRLGGGGGGEVYAALDTKLQREVAIKSLTPRLQDDMNSLARFQAEARNVAQLAHPNITTLYDVDQDGDRLFMVMELVRGCTLEAILQQRQAPLSVRESLAIMAQAIDGLAYAHERGVIHRDIKPSNLIITDKGQVKVIDFGIARKRESERLTRIGSVIGTLLYMSPEQCDEAPGDERSDIYSLAIVLYEMLAGKPPFSGSDRQLLNAHVNKPPPSLRPAVPGIDSKLESAIMKALSKRPEQRFPSVRAFGDAISATPLRAEASAIIASHTHLLEVPSEVPEVAPPSTLIRRMFAVASSRAATVAHRFNVLPLATRATPVAHRFNVLPLATRVVVVIGAILLIGTGVYFNPFVPLRTTFEIGDDLKSIKQKAAEEPEAHVASTAAT